MRGPGVDMMLTQYFASYCALGKSPELRESKPNVEKLSITLTQFMRLCHDARLIGDAQGS